MSGGVPSRSRMTLERAAAREAERGMRSAHTRQCRKLLPKRGTSQAVRVTHRQARTLSRCFWKVPPFADGSGSPRRLCVCAQVCALRGVTQAPRGVRALTLQRTVAPSRSDRPATSSCSWLSAMTYLAARGRQGVSEDNDKDPPPTALSRYKQRRWTHRERSGRCGSASPRTPAALRETPQGSAAAGT